MHIIHIMPCNDITDRIELELDDQERLVNYQLMKRTCGAAVGGYSLILPWLKELPSAQAIFSTNSADFLEKHEIRDETHEFLLLKHFFSVKNALEVLLGFETGKREDRCAIDEVEYEPNGHLKMTASIRLDVVTSQIKACGGCKSCGSRSQKASNPTSSQVS